LQAWYWDCAVILAVVVLVVIVVDIFVITVVVFLLLFLSFYNCFYSGVWVLQIGIWKNSELVPRMSASTYGALHTNNLVMSQRRSAE